MNHNIIPIPQRPMNDMDMMVRLCNSPTQQRRRLEKRKAALREKVKTQATVATALLSVGTVLGFLLGIMI